MLKNAADSALWLLRNVKHLASFYFLNASASRLRHAKGSSPFSGRLEFRGGVHPWAHSMPLQAVKQRQITLPTRRGEGFTVRIPAP